MRTLLVVFVLLLTLLVPFAALGTNQVAADHGSGGARSSTGANNDYDGQASSGRDGAFDIGCTNALCGPPGLNPD
jgi:hypothetical protein